VARPDLALDTDGDGIVSIEEQEAAQEAAERDDFTNPLAHKDGEMARV